jgi:outer membrane protein TolC
MLLLILFLSDTLKLKDVIELAITRNLEIKSYYENFNETNSKFLTSFLPQNPKITYREMFMEENLGIGIEIPIPTKLLTKGFMVKDESKRNFYLYKAKTLEIIRMVKEAYYEYFLFLKKIEITKEIINLLEKMKEFIKNKYVVGENMFRDYLIVEIEIEKMKNNLKIFEAEKRNCIFLLNSLLNSEINEFIPEEIKLEEKIFDIDSIIKIFETKNPILKVYENEVKMKNKEKMMAIQDLIPDIMPEILFNTKTGEKKFAFSFEIPLFFFHEIGKIKEKNASFKKSKFEEMNAKVKLKEDLKSLYYDYLVKLEKYKLYKENILPKEEAILKKSEADYITGNLDILLYIENEKMYFETKIEYFESFVDVLKTISKIEELMGGEL